MFEDVALIFLLLLVFLTGSVQLRIVSSNTNLIAPIGHHGNISMTAEERYERLLGAHLKKVDILGRFRFKQPNKLHRFGKTQLSKSAANVLRANAPSKTNFKIQLQSESSFETRRPYSVFTVPRPNLKPKKQHKSSIHSSGTDPSNLLPSRLYLLLDHELQKAQTSREMTRTTMASNFFRLKLPPNINEPADNLYGARSKIIVDTDEESEASGFNELEELDIQRVPFQPRNHNWHLKSSEYSKAQFLPFKRLNSRHELHRGENEI